MQRLKYDKWKEYGEYRLGRLAKIKQMFFSKPQSLGKRPIPLIRQSEVTQYDDMVENAYWFHNEISFATLHIVGSGNGLRHNVFSLSAESIKRSHANTAWLKEITKRAIEEEAKAIVLALHAELFRPGVPFKSIGKHIGTPIRQGRKSTYGAIVLKIATMAKEFGKPVLVIHGDAHRFVVDRPFLVYGNEENTDKHKHINITRLQVFGAPELKAVKITVEPNTPWVFSFSPFYN